MTIAPSGAPVWVKSNDHTDYGGDLNKRNYQSQGAVNGQTDFEAEELCRLAADAEAVGNTGGFSEVTYTQDDSTPNDPTVVNCDQQAGAAPTGARQSNGYVVWTWLASYSDPYGVAGALNITHAEANCHGSTAAVATCDITAANVVGVRCFNPATGAAIQDVKVTLTVSTGGD